ncbi:MAG TPA: carbamoyltransferase HypF [Opitutaceae bacterium]|nr:carbamoyltransferase HypF [Opitutaceae bacterium]
MPTDADGSSHPPRACVIAIEGTVQGVGFRPFVARTAARLGISGSVRNTPRGVTIEALGPAPALAAFTAILESEAPPAAVITAVRVRATAPPIDGSAAGFAILDSDRAEAPVVPVTPDLALCDDCRRELSDPRDRRHAYPFINCTNCGPRYSIVLAVPYDRERTTMSPFTMCPDCAREFADPANRRFHAQPNACGRCGPRVTWSDGGGASGYESPIAAAAAAVRRGEIVAVKGIGGFHLVVDATNGAAVWELRRRKHRDEKPFAVMFDSLSAVRAEATVSDAEAAALRSPAAPIVLVRRRADSRLAPEIAPDNPWIGALLAYTPLHVLLLEAVGRPVVATSGNLSEEPLCTDDPEARARLASIADCFLGHDRAIARAVDDSVLRIAASGPVLLRRARGLAPAPLALPADARGGPSLLCVGAHLKSTVAVTVGSDVVVSPHIGDLDHALSLGAFRRAIDLLRNLHGSQPEVAVCDAHPDYASTEYAAKLGVPLLRVQHHLAHVLACLLEHDGGPDRVLGVAWDGSGYGGDGTVWGGEFIVVDRSVRTARRVAHLRPFRLPGGEAAVREPRRTALALLHAMAPLDSSSPWVRRLDFSPENASTLLTLLERGRHAPVTTSAGRLFDGVAALLRLRLRTTFEGQAAIAVEAAAASHSGTAPPWPMPLVRPPRDGVPYLDWEPALDALLAARRRGTGVATVAAQFHATLAAGIAEVAGTMGIRTIALSGGCFQNARLLDLTIEALETGGHEVLRPLRLPPNDGAIAAGQALAARWGITTVG